MSRTIPLSPLPSNYHGMLVSDTMGIYHGKLVSDTIGIYHGILTLEKVGTTANYPGIFITLAKNTTVF